MAALKTKADLYELGSQKSRVWKSLALSNGDTLTTGLKDVWAVLISDSSKWAAGGFTVSTDGKGTVTFNLAGGGPFTLKVVVFGR